MNIWLLVIEFICFLIGFAMLLFGNDSLNAADNWFGLSNAGINPNVVPVVGIFLMGLGAFSIIMTMRVDNSENSGGR